MFNYNVLCQQTNKKTGRAKHKSKTEKSDKGRCNKLALNANTSYYFLKRKLGLKDRRKEKYIST